MKLTTTIGRAMLGVSAAFLPLGAIAHAGDVPPDKKEGSHYVQCDGHPNNVTSGETVARLIGAVTLLGLFAPPPEAPDASKRKFGADGVAACSALIDGDKREGNPARRVGLLMGRAIHHIEAKDYDAAIADTDLARAEATTAGLMADPYFARSRARGIDMIRAAALFRQGKVAEARDAQLRGAALVRHSAVTLGGDPYGAMLPSSTPDELQYFDWQARAGNFGVNAEAARFDELGRFEDAAALHEAQTAYFSVIEDDKNSAMYASTAVTEELAGHRDLAKQRAQEAQANFDQRRADGKPDSNPSQFVELIDLYHILAMADGGDMKGARRLFAARSEWTAPSFGTVVEVTRRLRADASADEQIGSLSRDPSALWQEHVATIKAAMLSKDDDNKTLFSLMPLTTTASAYEAISKQVWDVQKSKIVLTIKPKDGKPRKYDTLFLAQNWVIAADAYPLHAALLAKSRGQHGFIITPLFAGSNFVALVLTGNHGDPGISDALYNDADQVIADLSPIIPSPDMLRARREATTPAH